MDARLAEINMEMFLRQPGCRNPARRGCRPMALRPRLSTGLLLSDIVEHTISEGYRFPLCILVISAYRVAMGWEERRRVDK